MNTQRVLVAGTHTLSEAYPNVRYRIEALKQHPAVQVREVQASSRTSLDYASKQFRLLSLLMIALHQAQKSIRCVVSILRNRHVDALYVPYPAVPVLFLLSFVPARYLPKRIVADVFISLYDTIVIDRQLLGTDSLFARCLRQVERRALLMTTIMLTDTPENSGYLAALLNLPASSFKDLPLSINEACFKQSSVATNTMVPSGSVFKVLFVGTLVPLHRIDVILDALTLLKLQRIIEVTFIGDGQQSFLLENFLKQANYDTTTIQVRWVRAWQSSAQIQRYVQEAHLCLGIMGNEGKSSRVWPFKNYIYMASGKALITAETETSTRLRDLVDYPAFITVNTDDPEGLATSLLACANDPGFLIELSANARRFFNEKLSLRATRDRLVGLVTGK